MTLARPHVCSTAPSRSSRPLVPRRPYFLFVLPPSQRARRGRTSPRRSLLSAGSRPATRCSPRAVHRVAVLLYGGIMFLQIVIARPAHALPRPPPGVSSPYGNRQVRSPLLARLLDKPPARDSPRTSRALPDPPMPPITLGWGGRGDGEGGAKDAVITPRSLQSLPRPVAPFRPYHAVLQAGDVVPRRSIRGWAPCLAVGGRGSSPFGGAGTPCSQGRGPAQARDWPFRGRDESRPLGKGL